MVAEMQEALKDIFGSIFETMLQGEMNAHLGYGRHERGEKENENRRNGYSVKALKTTVWKVKIEVPRIGTAASLQGSSKDVSAIEDQVLSMYANGLSQRDIAEMIEEIYGSEISHEMISNITDCVLEELDQWQNRPLKKLYAFLFVDCLYVTLRKDYEAKKYAVDVILGYDINGKKEIWGL